MTPPLREVSPLVAIAGPTGSGKSALALQIAHRFDGEIVNCDSIQVYRGFDIGSAKLPLSEREGIPHHLIDALEPEEVFTAGGFARVARPLLREIASRGRLPIVTGGTGFYLRALIDGLAPGPERDDALRTRLNARNGRRPGALHRLLRRLDPATAARIHPNDHPKVLRALEICLLARKPAAQLFSEGRDALTGFRSLKIGLLPDRETLYRRLETRLEAMFESGLINEVQGLLANGVPREAKPFEAIGYKQALQVVEGALSLKDALYYARRDTRRYAKRQMTWFRQEPALEVFPGFGSDAAVSGAVIGRVAAFLS